MPITQYQINSAQITVPGTGVYTFALPGNSRRLLLVFSASIQEVIKIANAQLASTNEGIISCDTRFPTWFTYRDFGPIIRQPIYVATITNPATVTVTEVYPI